MTLDVDALLGAAYRESQSQEQSQGQQQPPRQERGPPGHGPPRGHGPPPYGHGPPDRRMQEAPSMLPPQLRRPGEGGPPRGHGPPGHGPPFGGEGRNPPSMPEERRDEGARPYQWKSRRPASPPRPMDPEQLAEQNARTVFAAGLPHYAHMRELYEFFEKAGKVKDISLVHDKATRRPKGFGYVEYASLASIPAALALSGSLLDGHVVKIVNASEDTRSPIVTAPVQGPSKLYFVEVDNRLTEMDLTEFFRQAGNVERVSLQMDRATRESKGRGYVKFRSPEDAKFALLHCNGYTILDKTIQLSMNANIFYEVPYVPPVPRRSRDSIERERREAEETEAPSSAAAGAPTGMLRPGIPLAGAPVPGTGPTNVLPVHGHPGDRRQQPSSCVALKNMFDPAEAEGEPNFDKELEEEVREECSQYGPVAGVIVDKDSGGCVYMRFGNAKAAQAAIAALHGRWFAGKQISATSLPESVFRVREDMRS